MKREMKKSDGEREISAHYKLGLHGERLACDYLTNTGYKILHTRHRIEGIEIDIIALKDDTLVFVEVKTRTGEIYGKPKEAVDSVKKKHIYKSAEYYIYLKHLENEPIRIDVIEVYKRKEKYVLNHIKQAITEKPKF